MLKHSDISDAELRAKIRKNEICFGANGKLKIYGKLDCKSGTSMKRVNRLFFISENEAKAAGFRPCGQCMKNEYLIWKNGSF